MAITVQEAQVLFSADGMQQVNTEAKKAAGAMDGIVSAAKRAGGALGGIRSAFSGVGGILATVGAGAAISGIVKMAADAETLGTQLKVLTGDAASAQQVMGDIRQFAESTPFQTEEISDAARSLLAFGGNANTVVDELRMLGDISAGTGTPLKELSELYGKAKVQGRLFAEDINQLTGRGIPIIKALAAEFGVMDGDVAQLVESGRVGFPEMQRALAGMVGPGGKFGGLMQEMSQTTAGRFSTLVDQFKAIGLALGEQILPYANEFMTWTMDAMQGVTGIGAAFGSVLETAASWFTSTQNYFSDIGVVVGVLVGDMKTLWAGLFTDIPNYASAALTWVTENTAIAMRNISIAASNMWAKMERNSQQLGEHIAFSLGLSDEVLQIPQPTMEAMQAFAGFKSPETSAATQSVLDNINTQLAAARAEREAAMSQAEAAAAAPAAAADLGFVSKEQTAAAQTMKAAGEQQRVERAGALQTFQRLQDRLQQHDKLTGIAQNQLTAQQEAVKLLGSINGGLGGIATLGVLG